MLCYLKDVQNIPPLRTGLFRVCTFIPAVPAKHFHAQTIDLFFAFLHSLENGSNLSDGSNKTAAQGLQKALGSGGPKGFTSNGMKYDEHQHGLLKSAARKDF